MTLKNKKVAGYYVVAVVVLGLFFSQVYYSQQIVMGLGFASGMLATWQFLLPVLVLCYIMRNSFFGFPAAVAFLVFVPVHAFSAKGLAALGIEYDWKTALIGTFLMVTFVAAAFRLLLSIVSEVSD